jgi:hypothetical protein
MEITRRALRLRAEGTVAELLPGLSEIERRLDEFEVLSEPGRGATVRVTKWVR